MPTLTCYALLLAFTVKQIFHTEKLAGTVSFVPLECSSNLETSEVHREIHGTIPNLSPSILKLLPLAYLMHVFKKFFDNMEGSIDTKYGNPGICRGSLHVSGIIL